jgi:hypothetical protein
MSDADALGGLPEQFGRAALAISLNTALGFAIATIARSQLAGIGVGIGVYFAEGIAGIFLHEVIKWFPFSAAAAVVASGGDVSFGGGGGAAMGQRWIRHRGHRGSRLAGRRAGRLVAGRAGRDRRVGFRSRRAVPSPETE